MHQCRVYLPLGPAGVRTLHQDKGIRVADGYAVTTALERAHPEEDEEGLEYLALQDALAAGLAARESRSSLVVVVAADVPSDRLDLRAPATSPPSRLALRDAVALGKVVALHVEEPPAGGSDEPDLLWYDVTELAEVVRLTAAGR
ncbi:DUF6912 family protein [Lapillicoccus jejuensis]|uniref:Uncharacterized protein n=1 Tax=Lapillicoccus jejuensis TaxID=402171 RepID=A0A542E2L3_9MICO|nr:hypothetical protein [Lapillicoccus jejuensis]TQJ09580.1 hypothetical protein FB458_2692 [Lapillicoccus jejuensis]